jgi:hypothetical protein
VSIAGENSICLLASVALFADISCATTCYLLNSFWDCGNMEKNKGNEMTTIYSQDKIGVLIKIYSKSEGIRWGIIGIDYYRGFVTFSHQYSNGIGMSQSYSVEKIVC